MLGSLDHVTRQLIVHTSPTTRSSDFIARLEQLDRLFAPQPGRQAWTRSHQSLGAGAPAGDERCDERRPTCLMRRAEPLSSLAVEVLVEEDAIA